MAANVGVQDFQAAMDHAFVIPAYGKSAHLESCIESILAQSAGPGRIILGTSTPSEHLDAIAAKHKIAMLINPERRDIATDWNFVMTASNADFVTIAHQDDLYDAHYLETMGRLVGEHPDLVLAFSDYHEFTYLGRRPSNANLIIKRLLCRRVFGRGECIYPREAKERLLKLGNPICCPSVLINRARARDFRFSSSLKSNLDWDAWYRLAELSGPYVYAKESLLSKRVHSGSETSVTIANRIRQSEDRYMFERFWPKPLAALIAAVYSLGYMSNGIR